MKKSIKQLNVFVISCMILLSCNQKNESQKNLQSQNKSKFSKLTGPYLGQKPPGMTPEIFAPGIISTSLEENRILFSSDGNEVFYQIIDFDNRLVFYTQAVDNSWTKPEMPPFSIKRPVLYPFITKDGKKLLFSSPLLPGESDNMAPGYLLWSMTRKNGEWEFPQLITFGEENEYCRAAYVSEADNRNLYFQQAADVKMSKYLNGGYLKPERLSDKINSPKFDGHPHISPDESYLIFDSMRDRGLGEIDLYISFREKNGEWGEAINMDEKVNSPFSEFAAFVTQDGKYLFFCSNRKDAFKQSKVSDKSISYEELLEMKNSHGNGSFDFYWVSAKVIDELKPEYLK